MKPTTKQITRKRLYRLILLSLLAGFGICCSPENTISPDDDSKPEAIGTLKQFTALRDQALKKQTEKETFNAEDGISFTSNEGAHLKISANCLHKNGDPVTGEVELTFIDLYKKADMALTNKPTMGILLNGDKAPLKSGGEFFIEVRKDGVLLDVNCYYQLTVPSENSGGIDSEMSLWKGTIDEDGNLAWDEKDPKDKDNEMFVKGPIYTIFSNDFGWTNIDRFYNDPRPKTTLNVAVNEIFSNENSSVYLSYDGEASGLAQLDTFDEQTNSFSEHYGQIPIGLEVHLIFVTADGDDWRYAIKPATITEDGNFSFSINETQMSSYDDLVTAINDLP